MKINCDKDVVIVEALYSEVGHYKNDIIELGNEYDGNIVYVVPKAKISKESIDSVEKSGIRVALVEDEGVSFYLEVLRVFRRSESVLIFYTASYLRLLLASFMVRCFDYKLLVHFFPQRRRFLYCVVLNFFGRLSRGIIVYEESVRDDLVFKGVKGRIDVWVSRVVGRSKKRKAVSASEKIVVSAVGALNEFKSVEYLIRCLNETSFSNIVFYVYCKGLTHKEISLLHSSNNCVHINNSYLSQEAYDRVLDKSHYSFLFYRDDYSIRCSGQVLDMANHSVIPVLNDIPAFKYYVDKFGAGLLYGSYPEFVEILRSIDRGTAQYEFDFGGYESYYSLDRKISAFKNTVNL